MTASRPTLRLFWMCAAALAAVLAWITVYTLRLERREALAQASNVRQEAMRLALWRMDSAMTPVIAREAARPYFHYQSYYPTDRAYTNMLKEVNPGDVLVPSPLLDAPVGLIRLYFEIGGDGSVTSPQVPRGEQQRLARPDSYTNTNLVAAQDQLSQLSGLLASNRTDFRSEYRSPAPRTRVPSASRSGGPVLYTDGRDDLTNEFDRRQERLAIAAKPDVAPENMVANQALKSELDRGPAFADASVNSARSAVRESLKDKAAPPSEVDSNTAGESAAADETGRKLAAADAPAPASGIPSLTQDRSEVEQSTQERSPISLSDLAPEWIGPDDSPQLVFTRRVTLNGEEFDQGFWMDWQLTRSWLLSGIGDLLPWADLVPVRDDVRARPPEALGRTLASIPAELVVRETLVAAPIGWTPLRWGLLISWLAMMASLAVTWRVLRALGDLADRRGRFAAAVTHELRTPITTFRMYSQMLAEDMVPAERRQEYLATMNNESRRLAGIVESVLEYARLGRREPGRAVQELEFHALLAPLVEKLAEHAGSRGFELRADLSAAHGVVVKADPTGVERVLFNLVDNACKYAQGHAPQVVTLTVRMGRRHAMVTVADNGPGLTVEESRRVFEPYFRGPRTTELGVPGIGLGLALARGVARSMSGELKLMQAEQGRGAVFALMLELA